jgi:hypothetical protein
VSQSHDASPPGPVCGTSRARWLGIPVIARICRRYLKEGRRASFSQQLTVECRALGFRSSPKLPWLRPRARRQRRNGSPKSCWRGECVQCHQTHSMPPALTLGPPLHCVGLGPPGDRPATGLMAAILSAYLLPLALQGLASVGKPPAIPTCSQPTSTSPLRGWRTWRCSTSCFTAAKGDKRRRRRAARALRGCRAPRLGAVLVEYRRLYDGLDLAQGEAVELYVGH